MAVGKDIPLVQRQLGRELLRLRKLAGLDQRDIVDRIQSADVSGISQSTVSRAERGLTLLPLPQVLAWADACDATHEDRARLVALTQATFTQTESWSDVLPEEPQLQDAVRANEATARTLLNYSPVVIPGLVQTPGYAEHVLRLTNYTGEMDEAASLAGRWRRQEALADRSRRFGFLMPESALRWSPAGPGVLIPQLERLAVVATQENISIGVIRAGDEVIVPMHGFVIYADRDDDENPYVVMELLHGYMTESNPANVARYREHYERMLSTAATGQDAVALIQRVADEYRRLM